VLEGAARRGVDEREQGGVRVAHASGIGDDTIAELVAHGVGDGHHVTVVTADRELRDRARQRGGDVLGPGWLLERI
jgi:rRNA-processing protein FCF1